MRARRRFLYLADLDRRAGTEPGKTRPVLVIQTDLLNEAGHPSTWVLPCTTRLTGENLLRVALPPGIAGNRKECEVMIDQSRAIDNGRLVRRLKALPPSILEEVIGKRSSRRGHREAAPARRAVADELGRGIGRRHVGRHRPSIGSDPSECDRA